MPPTLPWIRDAREWTREVMGAVSLRPESNRGSERISADLQISCDGAAMALCGAATGRCGAADWRMGSSDQAPERTLLSMLLAQPGLMGVVRLEAPEVRDRR